MNLKNILTTNTPQEIIDLINYNFDQLVANGYGQQGTAGTIGTTGTDGVQGVQGGVGLQGSVGITGSVGSAAATEWANDTTTVAGTNIMVPKPDPSVSTPTTVSIGASSISANNERSQLVISRNSVDFDSNLRLTVPGSTDYVDFIQDVSKLSLGFNTGASNTLIKLTADSTVFKDSIDGDKFLQVDSNQVRFYKDTTFDSVVQFNDMLALAINGSATAGDVLVAADDSGLLKWIPPSSIGANVPIGTVVPIIKELYNATNFELSGAVTSATDYTTTSGAGRTGTEYDGWYLCHGYTWFNISNGISYETPGISGKTFTDNATVEQTTLDTILSGAFLDITANIGASTTVQTSIEDDPIIKRIGSDSMYASGHTQVTLVKLPHIIYLGVPASGVLSWRFTDVTNTAVYNTIACKRWTSTTSSPTVNGLIGSSGWTNVQNYEDVTVYLKIDSQCIGGCDAFLGNTTSHLYKAPGVLADSGIYWHDEQAGNSLNVQITWNNQTMAFTNQTTDSGGGGGGGTP